MKSKRLIRFYFSADTLNGALDNLILMNALKSEEYAGGGEYYAERILKIIRAKGELQELWQYLDGIMRGLSAEERAALRFYGSMRVGIKRLKKELAREIKRVTVKFTRRVRCLDKYREGVRILGEYYSLT